jgi:hypothetical protein
VGRSRGAGNPSPDIVWQDKPADIDAGNAIAATGGTRTPAAREDAKKFLTEALAIGRRPATAIIDEAEANGISEWTLLRAKADSRRHSQKGRLGWRLDVEPAW